MGSDSVALNASPARLRRVSMDSSTRTCRGVPLGITADVRCGVEFSGVELSGADSVAGFAPAATSAVGHGVLVLEHPASSNTGKIKSHMRITSCTVHAECQRATLAYPQVSANPHQNYLAQRGKIEIWGPAQRNPDRGFSAPINSSPH